MKVKLNPQHFSPGRSPVYGQKEKLCFVLEVNFERLID